MEVCSSRLVTTACLIYISTASEETLVCVCSLRLAYADSLYQRPPGTVSRLSHRDNKSNAIILCSICFIMPLYEIRTKYVLSLTRPTHQLLPTLSDQCPWSINKLSV